MIFADHFIDGGEGSLRMHLLFVHDGFFITVYFQGQLVSTFIFCLNFLMIILFAYVHS